jgi:hypothetical protein
VRKPIERIWSHIDAVENISEQKIIELEKNQSDSGQGLLSVAKKDPELWRMQGIRFLKHKNYQQAIKCFIYSDDRKLAVRCRGYMLASQA